MDKEDERQVSQLLLKANKTWNYLYESLERLNFKRNITLEDKEYITFVWQKTRETKAFLVNVKNLIGENIYALPHSLKRGILKRLNKRIDEMINTALEVDRIYLK